MEEVMLTLRERCKHICFWYKVYADDLVIMVNYTKVEEVLTNLFDVSREFDLKVNPKKSAILLVHGHEKLETDVCGIER